MGGMPGVRRDVLQWLVALNLSFPIRNLRRDFSNGFLVAEIFSRYFPSSIQMHSFDTGTGIAKKRNNWSQLEKFFKKKNFHMLKEEIENIINCDSNEGAGPLLDRMYGFLTHKRCTPIRIDGNAQDLWLGLPDSAEEPPACKVDNCTRQQTENCCVNQGYYDNGYGDHYDHYEGDHDFRSSEKLREEDDERRRYHGQSIIRTGAYRQDRAQDPRDTCYDLPQSRSSSGYSDSNPVLSADNLVHYRDSVICPQSSDVNHSSIIVHDQHRRENVVYPSNVADGHEPKVMSCRDENNLSLLRNKVNLRESPKKAVVLSAVERARLKENKRIKKSIKDNLNPRVVELKGLRWREEANKHEGLAFRGPNRQRQFRSYTISDWRKQQNMTGHVHLGGLGPKNTVELSLQKEVYQKVKQFARSVQAANSSKDFEPKKPKANKLLSSRAKAKEFAMRIPKPKIKKLATCEGHDEADGYTHIPSELEMLETQHHADKQKFEAMRRDLEHFLR